MDAKTKDIIKILSYINTVKEPTVSVSDIIQQSGAEKLRVLPILYELYLNNAIIASSYTYWGVPHEYQTPTINT